MKGVALVLALFVAWASLFIFQSSIPLPDGGRAFCLLDDAMISMRYAHNLAQGHGPVWNVGQPPVEGYTNPLMVAVMAVLLLVLSKSGACLCVQLLGLAVLLGNALLIARLFKTLPVAVVLVIALSPYTLAYWALSGMETGLVALFLSLGLVAGFERRPRLLTLACVGLYFTRPDAFVYVTILFWVIGAKRQRWFTMGVIAAAIAAHVGFRLWYYGAWVPNTAVLKLSGMPLSARLRDGIVFVFPFLRSVLPTLALAVVAVSFRWSRLRAAVVLCFLVAVAYQVSVGGDPWGYWRIMSPTVPLLLVLAADGARRLMRAVMRERVPAATICALMLLYCAYQYNRPFKLGILLLQQPSALRANAKHVRIALAIKKLTRPTATVGVFWAGTIPFFSGRPAVDFLGKSDPVIARLPPDLSGACGWLGMRSVPGHNKCDLNRSIKTLRPTYIQAAKWCGQDLTEWVRGHYVLVRYEGVELFLLKGSPDVNWEAVPVGAARKGVER